VGTLSNGWTEILSYFIERVTNRFVEGMNRAIRAIINRALGYRNFQVFRLKVLAEYGGSSSSHYSAKTPFFQMAKVHRGSGPRAMEQSSGLGLPALREPV